MNCEKPDAVIPVSVLNHHGSLLLVFPTVRHVTFSEQPIFRSWYAMTQIGKTWLFFVVTRSTYKLSRSRVSLWTCSFTKMSAIVAVGLAAVIFAYALLKRFTRLSLSAIPGPRSPSFIYGEILCIRPHILLTSSRKLIGYLPASSRSNRF